MGLSSEFPLPLLRVSIRHGAHFFFPFLTRNIDLGSLEIVVRFIRQEGYDLFDACGMIFNVFVEMRILMVGLDAAGKTTILYFPD
jgi:hypothetical protein